MTPPICRIIDSSGPAICCICAATSLSGSSSASPPPDGPSEPPSPAASPPVSPPPKASTTFAATGSTSVFHVGRVASIHSARLHAVADVVAAEKDVVGSSHSSASRMASATALRSDAPIEGSSPAAAAAWRATSRARSQFTGPPCHAIMSAKRCNASLISVPPKSPRAPKPNPPGPNWPPAPPGPPLPPGSSGSPGLPKPNGNSLTATPRAG